MTENEYQYNENIRFDLYSMPEASKKLQLSDVSNIFLAQDTEVSGIKTVYKTTKLKKSELLTTLYESKIKIEITDLGLDIIDFRKI